MALHAITCATGYTHAFCDCTGAHTTRTILCTDPAHHKENPVPDQQSEQLELPFDPPLPAAAPKPRGITVEDIENRMGYHPATPGVAPYYDAARKAVMTAAKAIVELTPPGREQSLAVTHLEDALMWASKAIALTTPADLTDTARVARVLPQES